jgi:DNA-directed RNA polymerase specialized sigma24 family protein
LTIAVYAGLVSVEGGFVDVEEELDLAERYLALRQAFGQLPIRCQRLLTMLFAEPRLSYREISAQLSTPVGGIGPTRDRCLDRLRRCPALAALIERDLRIEGEGEVRDKRVVER